MSVAGFILLSECSQRRSSPGGEEGNTNNPGEEFWVGGLQRFKDLQGKRVDAYQKNGRGEGMKDHSGG